MDTVYGLGDFIGMGHFAFFFRIQGKSRLGVKISSSLDDDQTKAVFESEQSKANKLRELGVPVLRYLGIIRVRIPEDIAASLYPERSQHPYYKYDAPRIIAKGGTLVWGLAIEIAEDDVRWIDKWKVRKQYEEQYGRIRQLGIQTRDSSEEHNVLWSRKKGKLYFIDFDDWIIPENVTMGTETLRPVKNWWRKLLGI